jgi:hypothetical protein
MAPQYHCGSEGGHCCLIRTVTRLAGGTLPVGASQLPRNILSAFLLDSAAVRFPRSTCLVVPLCCVVSMQVPICLIRSNRHNFGAKGKNAREDECTDTCSWSRWTRQVSPGVAGNLWKRLLLTHLLAKSEFCSSRFDKTKAIQSGAGLTLLCLRDCH